MTINVPVEFLSQYGWWIGVCGYLAATLLMHRRSLKHIRHWNSLEDDVDCRELLRPFYKNREDGRNLHNIDGVQIVCGYILTVLYPVLIAAFVVCVSFQVGLKIIGVHSGAMWHPLRHYAKGIPIRYLNGI